MRTDHIICIFLLCFATGVYAQSGPGWQQAQKASAKWRALPADTASKFADKQIKYRFTNKDDHQYISRSWITVTDKRQTQVTQNFFLEDNELLTADEHILWIYDQKDTAVWSGKYFFRNGELVDLTTLGHGKSETDSWDPAREVQHNLEEALYDLDVTGLTKRRKDSLLVYDFDNDGREDTLRIRLTDDGHRLMHCLSTQNYKQVSSKELDVFTEFNYLKQSGNNVVLLLGWLNNYIALTIVYDPEEKDFRMVRYESAYFGNYSSHSDYDLLTGNMTAEVDAGLHKWTGLRPLSHPFYFKDYGYDTIFNNFGWKCRTVVDEVRSAISL